MTDRDSYIRHNIAESHAGTEASRYQKDGLTTEKSKLSSANFDKLMESRGIGPEDSRSLKDSFDKNMPMEIRHAHQGEKFVTTHGTEKSSGVFVSAQSLGANAEERINRGALPCTNSAEYETAVQLDRDQNLIYGTIAPQHKFSMLDPQHQERNGGAIQVVTDGGYQNGAVINMDSKFPVPGRDNIQQTESDNTQYIEKNALNKTGDGNMNNDFDTAFLACEDNGLMPQESSDSVSDTKADVAADMDNDGIGH